MEEGRTPAESRRFKNVLTGKCENVVKVLKQIVVSRREGGHVVVEFDVEE